jgi:hypothetical protein
LPCWIDLEKMHTLSLSAIRQKPLEQPKIIDEIFVKTCMRIKKVDHRSIYNVLIKVSHSVIFDKELQRNISDIMLHQYE